MTPVPLDTEALDDAALLRFPALARLPGLRHAVTTRPWNLAPHRGPHRDHAVDRRRRLCAHLGFDFDRLTAPDQVHSAHVLRVTEGDVGAGRFGRDHAIRFVDGLVCDLPGVPILQLSGDCPLLLVYDPDTHAFGTAHASWRGTVARIATQLVRRMIAEFHADPARLAAAISPCASVGQYQVGPEVRRIALASLPDAERFFALRGNHLYFDLKAANHDQLVREGIPPQQIEVAAECTIADNRFFSHRRDGPDTGRFALLAGLSI